MNQNTLMRELWLALIRDIEGEPVEEYLRPHLQKNLLSLIGDAQEVAEDLFHDGRRTNPSNKFWILFDHFYAGRNVQWMWEKYPDEIKQILFLLRFPKRYTPRQGVKSSLPEFWERNEKMKSLEFNGYHVQHLRDICHRLLKPFWRYYNSMQGGFPKISNGNDFEGSQSFMDKFRVILETDPSILPNHCCLNDRPYPINFVNRLKSVPKSYKTKRNIAMEQQFLTYKSTAVADALEQCLPEFVSVRDQERNQQLCWIGSSDGSLATIDEHAASDSVSCKLLRAVFPWDIYRLLLQTSSLGDEHGFIPYKPKFGNYSCYYNKEKYDPTFGWLPDTRGYGMISTMGNRITFPLEEFIFAAIVILAHELSDIPVDYDSLGVYGDDIIVPTDIADCVISLLEVFGFQVNQDKTFTSREFLYRESCGVEFFQGHDVSCQYWPREEVTDKNLLNVLIQLQHKYFKYPTANNLLVREIRKICPSITESFPYSVYDDIWDKYPDITYVHGSYRGAVEKDPSCELHTMLLSNCSGSSSAELIDTYLYYQRLAYPEAGYSQDPLLAQLGVREPVSRRSLSATEFADAPRKRKFLN